MYMKKPTQEQNEQALRVIIQASRPDFKICLVTQEERYTKKWGPEANEWWMMPAFIVDDRYWCGWDVLFGHDLVIDLIACKSWASKCGIFTDEFVFITDYYGYEHGAFYYRKQE